jgi:transposase
MYDQEDDMHQEAREELRAWFKLVVLELAHRTGVTTAYREFNLPRSTFYEWEQKYECEGRAGLYRQKPIAYSHPRKTSPEAVEKILELRRTYQMGALRIMYYLKRFHGINISESTVTRVLKAHGVGRLAKTAPRRALHSKR